jgi:hypothetical protein
LSSFELKNRYREATHPVEGRRWQLLWLISLGWTIPEAAKVIGINPLLSLSARGKIQIRVVQCHKNCWGGDKEA